MEISRKHTCINRIKQCICQVQWLPMEGDADLNTVEQSFMQAKLLNHQHAQDLYVILVKASKA